MKQLLLLALGLLVASSAVAASPHPTAPPELDIVADIDAVGGPIVLPPSGGQVTYTVTVTSNATETLSGCIWIVAVLPGERVTDPLRPVQFMSIEPGETLGPWTFTDRVPARARDGNYYLTVQIGGLGAGMILYADSFKFIKEAADGAASAEPPTDAPITAVSGSFPGPTLVTSGTAAGVEEVAAYPNPGRSTALRYVLADAADIHLAVYDMLGREVAVLADGRAEAGTHVAPLDGASLPAGTYTWRLVVGEQAQVGRVTLVR